MRSWKGRWALLTAFFISIACGQDRVQLCAACHGDDGNSTNPQIPSIAGQPKLFLENQLILFREELRKSEQMAPVVKGMKDPESSSWLSTSRSCRRRSWKARRRIRRS